MLIGNAPCSWGINYPQGNGFTWVECLDEVAAAGHAGTELGPLGFLPADPARLGEELSARGLVLMGATHVHTFGDAGAQATARLMEEVDRIAAILTPLGCRHLAVMDESNWYPPGREGVLDAAGWAGMIATLRAVQARAEGDLGTSWCILHARPVQRIRSSAPRGPAHGVHST